jgi:carboxyl-terminal processing protease
MTSNSNQNRVTQPILYAVLLLSGVFLGRWWLQKQQGQPFGNATKMEQIMQLMTSEYVDTVNNSELEEAAIRELLGSFDPHSVYIPARYVEQANQDLKGEYQGIGIEFTMISDTPYVVRVLDGGPAQKSGILPGDRILQVDDTSVLGVPNMELIDRIKGDRNTSVKLSLFRKYSNANLDVSVTRSSIDQKSVYGKLIAEDILYVRILRFAGPTHQEFLDLVESFGGRQKIKGVLVDLRDNGGGYLRTALNLLDEFVDGNDLLTYTDGKNNRRKNYNAKPGGVFARTPVACIINERSASASEIFSGVIQDLDRGTVLGQKSFGKGLVQETFRLKDGAQVRLTVSRYYIPSGRCIQKPYTEEGYVHESTEISDTSKFYTLKEKRVVYQNGGITPDKVLQEEGHSLRTGIRLPDITYLASNLLDEQYESIMTSGIDTWEELPSVQSYMSREVADSIHREVKNRVVFQLWGEEAAYLEQAHKDSWVEEALRALRS